jgi:ADP-heptose:LPS heptosyltransferase
MKYILAPFSNMPAKIWNINKYNIIINSLHKEFNVSPIIICSKNEYDYAMNNNLFLDNKIEFIFGSKDFNIIFSKVKNSLFYLGNDTGIMHVAAYFNIPIFAIFSSRDLLGKWEPDNNNVIIYRNNVDCAGCLYNICPYNNLCIEETTSADVYTDIKLFLSKNS